MPKQKDNISLNALQKKLGYTFKNINLLKTALNPSIDPTKHQFMEHLGDNYLETILREWGFKEFYPAFQSYTDFLSKARSNIILALVAENLGIVKYISNDYAQQEETLVKEHADILEALFYAIDKDGGKAAVKKVVLHIIPLAKIKKIRTVSLNGRTVQRDATTAVKPPSYDSKRIGSGLCLCTITFNGRTIKASGKQQYEAEHMAAYWMLHISEQERLRKVLFS